MTLWAAARVVRRLAEGELKQGRKLLVASLLLCLPMLGAVLLALVGRWGGGVFDQIFVTELAFFAPFLSANLFGGAIGDELDRGTAGFLFVRPAPRIALLVGRLFAVLPTLLVVGALSVIVGFVALYARFPRDLVAALPHLAAAVATIIGALTLYALFAISLGATFRKRPVATMLVIFLVDAGLASLPVGIRLVAPAYHLRVLAGLDDGGTMALPFTLPRFASVIYLVVLLVVAASIGQRRVESIEMTGESA